MVPFVYEGGVGAEGGRGGGGQASDLSLNAVLFVPKWSGLSSPFLSSFGKLGVEFIFISRFHTNMTSRRLNAIMFYVHFLKKMSIIYHWN